MHRSAHATIRPRIALALATILTATSGFETASAQDRPEQKPVMPAEELVHGPVAVSQDVGDVAVLVDNGLMVTGRNPFDLSGVTLRFDPDGDHRYAVSRHPASLDPAFGPALAFGFPEATRFPGDDDSQEIAFPVGFPFFGKRYESVWVNTDGNLTFGEPDFGSSDRDKVCHVLGPPRVSAFLHDWTPFNALNPTGNGSVHAVVRADPDRLVATWNGVADFEGGVSSTFQVTLYSAGAIEITIAGIDTPSVYGVVGIAEGRGAGPIESVDLGAVDPKTSLGGGAILEAFAAITSVSEQETAREFYARHDDLYDFLVILTDFPTFEPTYHSRSVSNHTHGIGDDFNAGNDVAGQGAIFDFTAEYGSSGELEQIVYMNDVSGCRSDPSGSMDVLTRKVMERYGASIRCAGTTSVAAPRLVDNSRLGFELPIDSNPLAAEDRGLVDLGALESYDGAPTNLAPGERLFAATARRGYSRLEQYMMGIRRAEEVGPFFCVDEPRSIVTGRPLERTALRLRGTRVDLTVQNIQAFAKTREPGVHGEGKRFWGPEGNLTVRYSRRSRRVDPFGDETIVLSVKDRELGDEADWIDPDGKPVDVKTMAFVLLVQSGPPADHASAIGEVDAFRRAWGMYANGPATGERGRFDTRLDPLE